MEEETVPVNIQVKEIIYASNDIEKTTALLKRLSQHKNITYPKIIDHSYNTLISMDIDFQDSLNMLIVISKAFKAAQLKSFLLQNIYKGFEQFWVSKYPDLSKLERMKVLQKHQEIYLPILIDFVKAFYEVEYITERINELNNEIWNLMDDGDYIRALKTIFAFKIIDRIDRLKLIDKLTSEKFNIAETDFIFSNYPELQKEAAQKLQLKNPKLCADFIKKYSLSYADFPHMLWQLEKNGLNYYIRQYPLYCAQLKFKHQPRYESYLVTCLISKSPKQAESLLKKYNLYRNPVFETEGVQDWVQQAERRKDQTVIYKNILEQKDAFGATELRVLGQPVDYLELEDLKMNEDDVIFVDDLDEKFQHAQKVLTQAKYIGLDCEFGGGVHKFDGQVLELVQLSTFMVVFIFDFKKLVKFKEFQSLMVNLLAQNQDITIVGCGCKQDLSLINKQIPFKNLGNKKVVLDIQLQYRENKHTIGLGKICQNFFGKKFSKFQQCSAWNARPLRKAQLHYAALDARVQLEVMKIEQPQDTKM